MDKRLILAVLWLLASSLVAMAQKADIIVVNGKVTTMNEAMPEAEAVAITGNRISDLGSNRDMLKKKGKHTRVIDAGGRRVIPGLFDSHLHVIRAGRFYNAELRWDAVPTLAYALQLLREQAERTPEGQWVRVVGGWNEYQFAEKRLPTLEEINKATGNTPTFILYLYGKAWLNKAGLKALGIQANTPNPPGGLIEKDQDGNPTGLLIAEPNAYILYSTLAQLPELTAEEKMNSTMQYMYELNRLGVTGVMDAGGGFQNFPDDYSITDSLNRLGKITVRLPYFLFAQKKGNEEEDYKRWTDLVDLEQLVPNGMNDIDYHVAGAGENLVMDAADFENFHFPRPELPLSMESNLKTVIKRLVQKRWPFRLHATYNESISRFLNVIEEVNAEEPLNGLLWFFDHAETVSEHNLQRIHALGGGIAIQHRMAYQGESFVRRYGKLAAEAAPPVKRMIEIGIPVALGTDGTRVASYNPWIALYWITTGKTVGGLQLMAKDRTLDRATALKLMTSGGYSLIREKEKGALQKGFFADLAILDRDFLIVPDEEIKQTQAILTIVDGRVVYAAQEYAALAPPAPKVNPAWSPVGKNGNKQRL